MASLPSLRLLLVAACLAVLTPTAAAALPACPFWDGDELHLRGRVGTAAVSVYLVSGWPSRDEDGVSGLALDHERWDRRQEATVALDGHLRSDCRLQLADRGGNGPTWQLRIVSRKRVEGTRTAGGRSEPLVFTIGAPFDCAAGAWETFSDPRWPMTFEYPRSSRFTVTGSMATIECPDASRLAWSNATTIVEHDRRVDATGTGGRTGTRVGPFVSFADGTWLVGEDDECGKPPEDISFLYCDRAAARPWHGFTVLQGIAPSEGRTGPSTVHYAFLLGDDAVVVSSGGLPDDVADLDAPPGRRQRSLGVAASRIVRSLRRR